MSAGRTGERGDWRIRYDHSRVGADAAFAAFPHDNLGIATHCRSHGLNIEDVPTDNVVLDATIYHYRPLDPVYAGTNPPHDWLGRLRLDMLVTF